MRSRGSAFRYTNLSVGIGESAGLWPLLQQGVKDDVELLLVVSVGYDAGKGGVGVGGGGDRDWQGGVVTPPLEGADGNTNPAHHVI